jgi:hypothetical protein
MIKAYGNLIMFNQIAEAQPNCKLQPLSEPLPTHTIDVQQASELTECCLK